MAEMEMGSSYAGDTGSQPSRTERVLSQGKEKASDLGGKAKQAAFSKVDARKGEFTERLDKIAQSIEELGNGMNGPEARIASSVAEYVRKAKGAIDGRSTDELASMAVSQLRERPAVVIAGAFALGFLGSRLLKS